VKAKGDLPLGMAGVAVATTDTIAEVGIRLRQSRTVSYDFNRIRVLSTAVQYDSLVFIRLTDSTNIYPKVDSCTQSYVFCLPFYTDSFSISFKQPDTLQHRHVVRGFLLENDFQGISYHSLGVNGAAVPSYLRCPLLGDDLRLIKPDLVIFSIGINDASAPAFDVNGFKRNYKQLLHIVKEVAPDCAILFTTNNDSYKRYRRRYRVNPNGPLVSEAFMELGKEYDAAVWDMFTVMGGLGSMLQWEKAGLAKHDKIHFTPFGYNILGDLLYNAFIESYLNHLSGTNTSSKN
jgi:lysophospholipase L1-like esterase